ncbi:hypothetical protein [Micromonospora sp. KLBMP9576]|uniref:hypothetical protein n=1 Tax=Micromonospora sp. KLBMP9576 TaxID=3424769 RepID=UPI003D93F570
MRETIDGAVRRQRVAVAVAVVVGLLWGAVAASARTSGPVALLTLVPIAVLLWATFRVFSRHGAGELRADEPERAFFAPPPNRASYLWLLLSFLTYTTAYQLMVEREGMWWLYPVLSGPCALVLSIALWRRVSTVALTPDGIAAEGPLRQLWVPWEALDPAVAGASYRHSGQLRLPVRKWDLVRLRGIAPRRSAIVETAELDVTPGLLAGAVAHYAAHPEHRAAIGTPQEYARLGQALAGEG